LVENVLAYARLEHGRSTARNVTLTAGDLFERCQSRLEQRVAERTRALDELNRDFVSFLENTTDFVYFKDENSRFRFCSQTEPTGQPGAGTASDEKRRRHSNPRLLGTLAAIGGIAWIVGVAMALTLPPDDYGDRDNTFAVIGLVIGASLIGIVLGQLGTRPGSRSRTGHAIAIAGFALGLTVAMGWPWFMVFVVGYPILVLLATARASMTGGLPPWSALVIGLTSVLALVGVFDLPELAGTGDAFALFGLIGVGGLVLAVAASRPPSSAPSRLSS
jgi:hypothetical protein